MSLVAACGLTTLDLIQYVDTVPGPDEKVQAHAAALDFGGPAANAAATAVTLEQPCRLISPLGTGDAADLVQRRVEKAGIELVQVDTDPGWHVPISSVVVDGDGRRSVVSVNARGSLASSSPGDALSDVAALLVDGHHLDLCIQVAQQAHNAGVPVLLDGGSWKPGLEQLIDLVDAAVVSHDFSVPGTADVLGSAIWTDRPVSVTHGPQPIRYRIGSRVGEVAVERVEAVDTMGAGDVFHGAWLAFVGRHGLTESNFPDGLGYAAQIATESCTHRGTRPA